MVQIMEKQKFIELINSWVGQETIVYKEGGETLIEQLLPREVPAILKSNRVVDYINHNRITLYRLVKATNAQKVVECGTRDGYSTSAICSALHDTGGIL